MKAAGSVRQSSQPCDLCGSSDSQVIGRVGRDLRPLVNVVCLRCGLMRQDPIPADAELHDFYERSYRLSYKGSAQPRQRDLDRNHRGAERRLTRLAPVLRSGMRILDVGSGTGMFLLLARERGYSVQGIEPDAQYAERLKREHGLSVHNGPWDTAEFAPGAFDLVVMNHVLEHVRAPTAALRRIHQWVAPDGYLDVAVPNINRPDASPLGRLHRAHLYGFSPETLEMTALKAGFAPADVPGFRGTHLLFQRMPAPSERWFIHPGHGETMAAFFNRNTMLRYLLRPLAYWRFLLHLKRGLFRR